MNDLPQEVIEVTEVLLDAVRRVHVEESKKVPVSAVLIFETIDENGHRTVDFSTTHDLSQTQVLGYTDFCREATIRSLFGEHDA